MLFAALVFALWVTKPIWMPKSTYYSTDTSQVDTLVSKQESERNVLLKAQDKELAELEGKFGQKATVIPSLKKYWAKTFIDADVAFDSGDVDVWKHVAITVDVSAKTAEFYIDGVAVGGTTVRFLSSSDSTTTPFLACARNLNNPPLPDMDIKSFTFIVFTSINLN